MDMEGGQESSGDSPAAPASQRKKKQLMQDGEKLIFKLCYVLGILKDGDDQDNINSDFSTIFSDSYVADFQGSDSVKDLAQLLSTRYSSYYKNASSCAVLEGFNKSTKPKRISSPSQLKAMYEIGGSFALLMAFEMVGWLSEITVGRVYVNVGKVGDPGLKIVNKDKVTLTPQVKHRSIEAAVSKFRKEGKLKWVDLIGGRLLKEIKGKADWGFVEPLPPKNTGAPDPVDICPVTEAIGRCFVSNLGALFPFDFKSGHPKAKLRKVP